MNTTLHGSATRSTQHHAATWSRIFLLLLCIPVFAQSTTPPQATSNTEDTSQTKPTAAGCIVTPPKKPGILSKLKKSAQNIVEAKAAKADQQIKQKTGADAGVKDTTHTAITEAETPKPCPPPTPSTPKQ